MVEYDRNDQLSSPKPFSSIERFSEGLDHLIFKPKKNFCFCIPSSWVVLPEDGHEVAVRNSNLSTIFLLLNTMIGSGILVQAFVFSQAGIVAAMVEYVIVGIMIYWGVDMLVRVGDAVHVYEYAQVARLLLGEKGNSTVDGAIVINNAGALLSYILIIGSLFTDVVDTFSNCSEWYCNVGFLTVLPILTLTVPLCLIRNFGHLAIISYMSIAVILSVVLLVLIGGPIRRATYEDDDAGLKTGNAMGCFQTIGDIVFALGFIAATFHSYRAMEVQTISNYSNCVMITVIAGTSLCFVIGLVGYICFRDNTETNVIENFPGPVGAVFKLAVIIHLVLYIPGDFVIMRSSLWKFFDVDVSKQSDRMFISTSLAMILTITTIAVILQVCLANVNALSIVVNITGGIAGSLLSFIIPGWLGLVKYPDDKTLFWRCVVLIVFGAAIMIMSIVGSVI